MLREPAVVARQDRRDAQSETLLAEEGVAAVTRTERDDLTRLGKLDDVLVLFVTGPRDIGLPLGEGHAH